MEFKSIGRIMRSNRLGNEYWGNGGNFGESLLADNVVVNGYLMDDIALDSWEICFGRLD